MGSRTPATPESPPGPFETHSGQAGPHPDLSNQNLWGQGLDISIFLLKHFPCESCGIQG